MTDQDDATWLALRARLDALGEVGSPPDIDVIKRTSSGRGWLIPQAVGAAAVVVVLVVGVSLLAAQPWVPAGAGIESPNPTAGSSEALPDVEAVSITSPTPEGAAGMAACGVLARREQVSGMAIIRPGSALFEFVPVTGQEPELNSAPSVFAVHFSGVIRLPTRAGPGSAAYVDADSPVCAVVDGVAFWYVTGPSVDSQGRQFTPPPAASPDRELPAPLP